MKKLYLTSSDYLSFNLIREVIEYERIFLDKKEVLVVTVHEPLIGQNYGFGSEDISKFYLICRYPESSFELESYPIHVHVCIPKEPKKKPSKISDLKNIAWASLFDNKEDAGKFLTNNFKNE